MKHVFELEGRRILDLETFRDEVSRNVIPGHTWGRNLDAFNDIHARRFGTPEGGFVLRWLNASSSRESLGHAETVRYLEEKVHPCHPLACFASPSRSGACPTAKGPTLFDILVEIIRHHGRGVKKRMMESNWSSDDSESSSEAGRITATRWGDN